MRYLSVLFFLLGALAAAEPIGSAELIVQAAKYDGRRVVYQGEVIGDILPRGDKVWLNVHDGQNALGIFTTRSAAAQSKTAGSYRQRGDIVRVSGVLHRACAAHGGDLDIHAEKIELIAAGFPLARPAAKWKIVLALLFAALTFSLGRLNSRLK
ncbi:MAG: DNA-binding protein [Candidatus Margulisbacteria bacterium]|jgi:hypothetical protein|nr:DNA-binding protein [Candidatus Margulisiibacteriota bacterium]